MAGIPIIGMGAACCAGYGVEAGFKAVAEGADCLSRLSVLNAGLKQVPLCGEIKLRPENVVDCAVPNATTGFALWAAREACGKTDAFSGMRLGLVLATTVAGMTKSESFYRLYKENPDFISHAARELAFHEPATTSSAVAAYIGAQGCHTVSTACSTGLHAIGMAKRLIDNDIYDLCLAVGSDALSILTISGFARLMLVDFDGCRPFDKRRIGISLGEGAGALLLASAAAARKLDREILGYVAGWGASADCHHMTAPHPEGRGARMAVEKALAEAGIPAQEIGFIASHGTATPDNDIAEIKAMRSVFSSLPPFGSMKRTLGHTLAASGTLEAVFAVCALRQGLVPATAGFEQIDEAIGAAPSQKETKALKYILKNSFGFGGNNAAIILQKA